MSHDITAFSKNSGKKISFISIAPFNQGKSWMLYESLDSHDYNNGVAGNGNSKSITEEKIKISLSKFKYLLGEPENEIYHIIKQSKACRSSYSILHRVLSAIGSKPTSRDFKIVIDRESAMDIQRFLEEIQNYGEVIVEFN